MRRVDYLIEDIRNHTENTDFSDTIGIADSEFLRFLNDAQYRIYALITNKHPQAFLEEYTQNTTGDTESYTLPFYVYLNNRIASVEYTSTGQSDDYYPLRPASLYNRDSGLEGDPCHYIRKSGNVLLRPVPQDSNGILRINYVQAIPRLDKRRGSVGTVTLDSGTKTITALTLNVSTDSVDGTVLGKDTRLSIVDAEGNIKMKNIQYDAVNSSTGVVTINSSFTYETGETIAVGDYVVVGRNSTTNSILPDSIERYLISYCAMKIFHRDSNSDIAAQTQELLSMENDIVASYADISDDIIEIPEIISYDDQWTW